MMKVSGGGDSVFVCLFVCFYLKLFFKGKVYRIRIPVHFYIHPPLGPRTQANTYTASSIHLG